MYNWPPEGNPLLAKAAMLDLIKQTRREVLEQAEEYLRNYRRAYDESLCQPRNLEEFDGTLRTVVAFHMGRFLIDNMIRDVAAAREAGK